MMALNTQAAEEEETEAEAEAVRGRQRRGWADLYVQDQPGLQR